MVQVTRKTSGPTGRMQKDRVKTLMTNCKRQVTRKPLGPTGWMEMGHRVPQVDGDGLSGPTGRMIKGLVGTRRMEKRPSGDFYDELQASRMSNYRSHRYTSDGEGSHRYTSHEKGSSGDFYDELQASQMSNYKSHRYTSDGESTMWRFMMKRHSLQIEYCSSQMCN